MSSNLGARYPAGYPVGTVSAVLHEPGERFATIIVNPSAHVDRSQPVILIWPADAVTVPVATAEVEVAKKGGKANAP